MGANHGYDYWEDDSPDMRAFQRAARAYRKMEALANRDEAMR